jgi:hypothetical protein
MMTRTTTATTRVTGEVFQYNVLERISSYRQLTLALLNDTIEHVMDEHCIQLPVRGRFPDLAGQLAVTSPRCLLRALSERLQMSTTTAGGDNGTVRRFVRRKPGPTSDWTRTPSRTKGAFGNSCPDLQD